MSKLTISHIAKLSSGVFVSGSSVKGSDIHYLQLRHFDENRALLDRFPPEIHMEERLKKYFLQKGDILIAAKGNDHFAAYYDGSVAPAIASSVFIVLRLNEKGMVLPEYLKWYLNHPETQKSLAGSAKGSSIPLITKQDIECLTIDIPSVEKQRAIVRLQELSNRMKNLNRRLAVLKERHFQQLLLENAKQDI